MTLLVPLFMQAGGADPVIPYSATNYRYGLGTALFSKKGVVDPYGTNGLLVTQRAAGANFTVDVAAGTAVILGTDIASQGYYVCPSDAVANVTIPAAPGSGTRVHRLVAQVRDKLNNGTWTTYDWVLTLLADTGTGTPAEPASSITLALVSVAAGQASVTNANITDSRPWARGATSTTGSLSIVPDWAADDSTRPAIYRRTSDGFVHLYGWVRRTANPFTAAAFTLIDFAGVPAAAAPSGIRDVLCVSTIGAPGCVPIVIYPSGVVYFNLRASAGVAVNNWLSFDGISYQR